VTSSRFSTWTKDNNPIHPNSQPTTHLIYSPSLVIQHGPRPRHWGLTYPDTHPRPAGKVQEAVGEWDESGVLLYDEHRSSFLGTQCSASSGTRSTCIPLSTSSSSFPADTQVPGKIGQVICTGNVCDKETYDYLRTIAPEVHVVRGEVDDVSGTPGENVKVRDRWGWAAK
jgi:hypothetical protein